MKTVNVAVRLDPDDNKPVLFFWNSNTRGLEWLECYSHIDQHLDCDITYMRRCKPMKTLDAAALALVREWANHGPSWEHVNARPVTRLTRSRGHAC